MTQEPDRKHERTTSGPPSAEAAVDHAGPAPGALDTLVPEVLSLPGREPIDVRGRSIQDVVMMIREAYQTGNPNTSGADSVDAGLPRETRESVEETLYEAPSEPLSPDDVVFTDETGPDGWIIVGFGDAQGEHGFIVEGTVRPDEATPRKPEDDGL